MGTKLQKTDKIPVLKYHYFGSVFSFIKMKVVKYEKQ